MYIWADTEAEALLSGESPQTSTMMKYLLTTYGLEGIVTDT